MRFLSDSAVEPPSSSSFSSHADNVIIDQISVAAAAAEKNEDDGGDVDAGVLRYIAADSSQMGVVDRSLGW